MKTVILGAGITGLSAGISTCGKIYESKNFPGGICRSYSEDGFHFEIGGGHWIFGMTPEVEALFSLYGIELKKYVKNSGVYFNHIFNGNIQDKEEYVIKDGTMKEFLFNRLGHDLCKLFFFPFNEKYTGGYYDEVIPENEYKNPTNDKAYNNIFYYPTTNLNGFIDFIAKDCDIEYGKEAEHIDIEKRIIQFTDKTTVTYNKLISTIPLNKLIRITELYTKLLLTHIPYTKTTVLNIGATKGRKCPDNQWLYIPFCDNGFYRVGFYSNVDSRFAPDNCVSIYVETNKPFMTRDIIAELYSWDWIKEVITSSVTEIPCAYTYQYNRGDAKSAIAELSRYGVYSTGRYGKWKFQGIAESIMDGLKANSLA